MSEEIPKDTALETIPLVKHAYLPGYSPNNPQPLRSTDLSNRVFEDLNAHNRSLESCNLSYTIFRRGYFRDASFTNCNFKGARFEDCSFRGAKISQCDFSYANFSGTIISSKEIIANLPDQPNQARELLQILRANALSLGDYDAQSLFVLEEIVKTREYYREVFENKKSYYKNKYGKSSDRISAWFKYHGLWIDRIAWGHGEKPLALIVSGSVLIVCAGVVNIFKVSIPHGDGLASTLLNSIIYCFNVFIDIPRNNIFRGFGLIDVFLVFMRYIFLGLFIGVVAKRISHR